MTKPKALSQSYWELSAQQTYAAEIRKTLAERYASPPLAYVHSFGCQQSVYDGERFKGLLAELGYGFTEEIRRADLILYNTCAVRENAEQRVFGNVGALKGLKKNKPGLIIALAGCMTEQQQVSEKLKMSYPYVDLVMGTNAFARLPELLYRVLIDGKRSIRRDPAGDLTLYEEVPVLHESRHKAFVPVMYGCDNFCSYCIVPYVRGRERSRLPDDIAREVENLVSHGCREVTLLGQNVNSYGKGLQEPCDFAGLLRRVNAIPGDFRIRFMTSHPKDCTPRLLDAMADCEKVCRHLHLPVQSGSDRILQAMNRHYDLRHYEQLLAYARQRMPGLSVTSDIIVGFPGETREDFEQTLELVRRVRYSALFTFIYSKRSGTAAEKLPDPTPAAEKSKWFRELLEVQGAIGSELLQGYVGQTLRVLAEEEGRTPGTVSCRTDDNTIVEVAAPPERIGELFEVRITEAMNWALRGEVTG